MTEPKKDDPEFWGQMLTMRDPAYREPTEDEVLALQDDLVKAVERMATSISTRTSAYRAAGVPVPAAVAIAPDWNLARIAAARAAEGQVRGVAEAAARVAGGSGANYGQLGAAWGITRQAARLRWPGVVAQEGAGAEPFEVRLSGGVAELHGSGGAWTWEATGADGTSGCSEGSHLSQAEAAAFAGAFLAGHADRAASAGLDAASGNDAMTAGRLAQALAQYDPATPVRVAVPDPEHPDDIADWDFVATSVAYGKVKYEGRPAVPTPYLILGLDSLPETEPY